jgi:hypothetical protein
MVAFLPPHHYLIFITRFHAIWLRNSSTLFEALEKWLSFRDHAKKPKGDVDIRIIRFRKSLNCRQLMPKTQEQYQTRCKAFLSPSQSSIKKQTGPSSGLLFLKA